MGDNAADEQEVGKKKAKEKKDIEIAQSDLSWLMKDQRGRRVVFAIIERCGVSKSSFSFNEHQTYFWEGERNIGLNLQAKVLDVGMDSENYYAMMLAENKGEKNGWRKWS